MHFREPSRTLDDNAPWWLRCHGCVVATSADCCRPNGGGGSQCRRGYGDPDVARSLPPAGRAFSTAGHAGLLAPGSQRGNSHPVADWMSTRARHPDAAETCMQSNSQTYNSYVK